MVGRQAVEQVEALAGDAGDAQARLVRVVAGIPRLARTHPLAARALLLESFGAGEPATKARFDALDAVVRVVGGHLTSRARRSARRCERARQRAAGSTEAAPGRRAGAGRLGARLGCARPGAPAVPTGAPSRRRGRAPGSLVPAGSEGRRLRPGPRREPRSFVEHSQNDRILDAVATIVASDGLDALTIRSLATSAEISSKAFYTHFASLDEAFAATLLAGARSALAAALPATLAPADWREGVTAGLGALLELFSEEPAFAHVALIGALAFGAQGAALQGEALDTLAPTLANAYERGDVVVAPIAPRRSPPRRSSCAPIASGGARRTSWPRGAVVSVLALAPATGLDEAMAFVTEASGR